VSDRRNTVPTAERRDAGREEAARIGRYFDNAGPRPWWAARQYLLEERRRLLERVARGLRQPPAALRICDLGCGDGADLAFWASLGVPPGQLAGTELIPERAGLSRERVPEADIRDVAGFDLPFADDSFDLTTASLVLTMIRDDALRRGLFEEMWRVTAPGGRVAVYDFAVRKPWNRQVVALNRARIAALGRPPDASSGAAPLLPLLGLALRLPAALRDPAVAILPRTHRLWVWRVPGAPADAVARA